MALFKIFKGDSTNLGVTGGTDKAKEGYAYFTPDNGKFYIDIDNGDVVVGTSSANGANRICINDDILVINCGTATTVTHDIPEN